MYYHHLKRHVRLNQLMLVIVHMYLRNYVLERETKILKQLKIDTPTPERNIKSPVNNESGALCVLPSNMYTI